MLSRGLISELLKGKLWVSIEELWVEGVREFNDD